MRISVTTYWVKQITRAEVLTEHDPVQSLVGLEDTPLGQDCSSYSRVLVTVWVRRRLEVVA